MSNLIDGLGLLFCQIPFLIDRILFQEVPNFVTRCEKVFVPHVIIFTGSELSLVKIATSIELAYTTTKEIRTRGWSSTLNASRSCLDRSRRAIVSSGLRKLGSRRYLLETSFRIQLLGSNSNLHPPVSTELRSERYEHNWKLDMFIGSNDAPDRLAPV